MHSVGNYCYEGMPGQPTFTSELPPHDDDPHCAAWAYSGLPDSRIEPTFPENLPAALALINSAGFDRPSGDRRIRVSPGTHTVQVVDDCWEVFRRFVPEAKR